MMNTEHTAAAKHFRKRLAINGVSAKCRAYVSCGKQYVTVNVPSYEAEFTDAEQAIILNIASGNHFTLSNGMPIDEQQRTYVKEATFELHI